MALKQSEAEKSLEERIARSRKSFSASSEALAQRAAMMGVGAGSKPRNKGAARRKARKSLPAIGAVAPQVVGPEPRGYNRRASDGGGAMTSISEIGGGGSRSGGGGGEGGGGGGGEGGRPLRRPSLKVKALSELREVQQKAREADSERVARARGQRRRGSFRKGSFADKRNQDMALPKLNEMCAGDPEALAEAMARITAGEGSMHVLASMRRRKEDEARTDRLEADLAAKAERQERLARQRLEEKQRVWIRVLWVMRCAHAAHATLTTGQKQHASAAVLQGEWRQARFRELTKKQLAFMRAMFKAAWVLKLQVRGKRRSMAATTARCFMKGYITRNTLFRTTIGGFHLSVVRGQRLARAWIACQAARTRAMGKLWRRIGTRRIETIIKKRTEARRRSINSKSAQAGGADGEKEERSFDSRKYDNFERFLHQTMLEVENTEVDESMDKGDRKAALHGLRRRRNSVVLFGKARDDLIQSTLQQVRKAHIARHATEYNTNRRIFDSTHSSGLTTLDVADVKASGGLDTLFSDNDAQSQKPVWPMLTLYTQVQQDESFLATVEQTVENALDEYESDRFKANANLQEFQKSTSSKMIGSPGAPSGSPSRPPAK